MFECLRFAGRQTELADLCQDDRQDLRIFGGEWRLTGLQQLVSVSQVCTFAIVSRPAAPLVSFSRGEHVGLLNIFHCEERRGRGEEREEREVRGFCSGGGYSRPAS